MVLDLIHDAGGLAFVAHPGLQKNVRKALPEVLELPFDGVEAFTSATPLAARMNSFNLPSPGAVDYGRERLPRGH